jgi:hypothetical protein
VRELRFPRQRRLAWSALRGGSWSSVIPARPRRMPADWRIVVSAGLRSAGAAPAAVRARRCSPPGVGPWTQTGSGSRISVFQNRCPPDAKSWREGPLDPRESFRSALFLGEAPLGGRNVRLHWNREQQHWAANTSRVNRAREERADQRNDFRKGRIEFLRRGSRQPLDWQGICMDSVSHQVAKHLDNHWHQIVLDLTYSSLVVVLHRSSISIQARKTFFNARSGK